MKTGEYDSVNKILSLPHKEAFYACNRSCMQLQTDYHDVSLLCIQLGRAVSLVEVAWD